ncbi:MAG: rhodanese-like domain-containing protein [Bacteroidetes bacterium]|nr:MAG: rhodanese-like domain-containing protein [Bacteroidota bacterium]
MRLILLLLIAINGISVAQKPAKCLDASFDHEVDKYLDFTIPVIDVDSLARHMEKYIILDAREYEEYETSHIAGAHYVGYDDFSKDALAGIPQNQAVVVYCSIGYRSEKVGEKLRKMGYTDVSNLYGSIFEWANRGYPIKNMAGKSTDTVHAYSRGWSKWITAPQIVKIW